MNPSLLSGFIFISSTVYVVEQYIRLWSLNLVFSLDILRNRSSLFVKTRSRILLALVGTVIPFGSERIPQLVVSFSQSVLLYLPDKHQLPLAAI